MLLYRAVKGNKECVTVNHEPGAWYAGVSLDSPAFIGGGTTFLYKAQSGGQTALVVNRSVGPSYLAVDNPVVSPDGRRIAYCGRPMEAGRFKARLVEVTDYQRDGPRTDSESGLFDAVGVPTFSPDSKHLPCLVQRDNTFFILTDGTLGPGLPSKGVDYKSLTFSPDGAHTAFKAEYEGGKKGLVVDDRPWTPHESFLIEEILFSPDGRQAACQARTALNNPEFFWIVDGEAGPRYSAVFSPRFVREGDGPCVFTYHARQGQALLLVRHVP